MTLDQLEKLLRGLSVYQDIVLAGETVRRGERDCAARWQAIAPHLQHVETVLDIGSNFGWFGLQVCAASPTAVVASVEADLRSAVVQRAVLESHISGSSNSSSPAHRICLLTARAGPPLVAQFAAAGARFDAALCLNVLHWVGRHREFLHGLGAIAGKIIIEHPDPEEAGAGVESIRREIGPIGSYLSSLFADRPVERIAFTESHRDQTRPRELWLVGPPAGWSAHPQPGIDAAAQLQLSPAWPPRSWWNGQLEQLDLSSSNQPARQRLLFTASGLSLLDNDRPLLHADLVRRLVARVPERGVASSWQRWRFRAKQLAGDALRRCGLRG